jgi:hypothetical protein
MKCAEEYGDNEFAKKCRDIGVNRYPICFIDKNVSLM